MSELGSSSQGKKKRFVSLHWKTFAMLVAVLFAVQTAYSFLSYRQQQEQFQQERERLNSRDLDVVEGLVATSYQRLLELGEILPLMSLEPTDQDSDPLIILSQSINLNFDRFSLNGSLDSIYLYDDKARMVEGRGMSIPLSADVVRDVLLTEKPVRNLYCSVDCLRYVALPVQLRGNRTGVIVVGRTLIDVVLSFNRQRGRDIGLAFRMPEGSSELPEWGLSLKYLTQKSLNIQVLQALAAQYPYSKEGGVYEVEYEGHSYEVVLKVPAGVQDDVAFWVLIDDLTEDHQLMFRKLLGSLALVVGGLLAAAVLQLSVLRSSMNHLGRIARQLPKLAESSFEEVRRELQPMQKRGKRSYDELDVLASSTLELTDQLQRLEISILQRAQKLQERSDALERERDFVQNLLNTAQAVVLTQDEEGRVKTLNHYGRRLLRVSEEQLGQVFFADLHHTPDSWQEHTEKLERIRRGGVTRIEGETCLAFDNGVNRDVTWMHARLNSLSGAGPALLSIGIDITGRKEAERRLYWLANHDPLTSLPNRTLFNDRLTEVLNRARTQQRKVAIFFCDLDGFKDVNDSMGHLVGDELLKQAARRLQQVVGAGGNRLSRMGSDEFMVIWEYSGIAEELECYADQILHAFQRPFQVEGFEVYCTLSIGIAISPDHGVNSETLTRNADVAIYQAKDDGKNRWRLFNQVLGDQRDERFSLVNDLHKALEMGELHLHYQPQIDSLTGQLVGVEALLRWQHPVAGMISPAKFIPLAEEQGLIVPIGEWVMREACRQMKEWQAQGLENVQVGVNLAGQQLMHERLLAMVDDVLQTTGLEPAYLDLEVTENFLIRQPELLVPKLHKLREKGVSLSMDDFGTGFSSLSYLKKLPVNTLKIDQSFVRDIGRDKDDESIVRSIIVLCQSLGIEVLAEGVETEPQLRFLQEHQCSLIQGYYYSKPLPPEELITFALALKERTPEGEKREPLA